MTGPCAKVQIQTATLHTISRMGKLHATMLCVGIHQRIARIRPASPAASHATLHRIRDYVMCQATIADSIWCWIIIHLQHKWIQCKLVHEIMEIDHSMVFGSWIKNMIRYVLHLLHKHAMHNISNRTCWGIGVHAYSVKWSRKFLTEKIKLAAFRWKRHWAPLALKIPCPKRSCIAACSCGPLA